MVHSRDAVLLPAGGNRGRALRQPGRQPVARRATRGSRQIRPHSQNTLPRVDCRRRPVLYHCIHFQFNQHNDGNNASRRVKHKRLQLWQTIFT